MEGLVKTLGVLMVLAAVALWAALIFFVPAALIKFLWQSRFFCKKWLTNFRFDGKIYRRSAMAA